MTKVHLQKIYTKLGHYTIPDPKKKCVYLANAYSAVGDLKSTDEGRFQSLCRRQLESFVGGQLKKKYNVTLILPIAISASIADICNFDTGFEAWAEDDYNFISRCDELWVLVSNGWFNSQGVLAEIEFANKLDLPVKWVNPSDMKIYNTVEEAQKDNDYL